MSLTDGGGIFVRPELALILKRDEQPLELKAKAEVVRPELSISSLTSPHQKIHVVVIGPGSRLRRTLT